MNRTRRESALRNYKIVIFNRHYGSTKSVCFAENGPFTCVLHHLYTVESFEIVNEA